MGYKAFVILAPPNSGSRLLTRYLIESGCLGEAGYTQVFDIEVPDSNQHIVWKTHSIKDGTGTIPLTKILQIIVRLGYEPVVILLNRDIHACALGQVKRGYGGIYENSLKTLQDWYAEAYSFLKKKTIDWMVVSYEAIVASKEEYLEKVFSSYNLKKPTNFYIEDCNEKHFSRRDRMNYLSVNKSGIPFSVRHGTVDANVLDEVIMGDCYKLNQIKLRQAPNIIDVGAHIGGFTKLCAWKWPHGRIFAFEANPRNWDILEANVSDIREKVSLFKGALVGEEPVNKRLVINALEADRVTGGWGIIYANQAYTPGLGETTEDIERFYYLKDILPAFDKIDILKLDCEGSEWSILEHMTDEELEKVDYLVAEIHCGALGHQSTTYKKIREKILKHFICPELMARFDYKTTDLFNIVACNRKLLPKR